MSKGRWQLTVNGRSREVTLFQAIYVIIYLTWKLRKPLVEHGPWGPRR